MVRLSGDSTEQQQAGEWLREQVSRHLGVQLIGKRVHLERGSYLEVDGYCHSPRVLCEIRAHIGSPKSAQKNKVMKDGLMLLFAKMRFGEDARCILVFGDKDAAAHFTGTSWMAECLARLGVEIQVIEMPPELRETVLAAQQRQYR